MKYTGQAKTSFYRGKHNFESNATIKVFTNENQDLDTFEKEINMHNIKDKLHMNQVVSITQFVEQEEAKQIASEESDNSSYKRRKRIRQGSSIEESKTTLEKEAEKVMKMIRSHYITLEPVECDANHYVFKFKDHIISEFSDILFDFESELKTFYRVQEQCDLYHLKLKDLDMEIEMLED